MQLSTKLYLYWYDAYSLLIQFLGPADMLVLSPLVQMVHDHKLPEPIHTYPAARLQPIMFNFLPMMLLSWAEKYVLRS